jgi:hypothetical protein
VVNPKPGGPLSKLLGAPTIVEEMQQAEGWGGWNLTLIVPDEVKVDLTDFYIKLRKILTNLF